MSRVLPVLVAFLFVVPILADDEYKPEIASASNEAELALGGFQLPDNIEGRLLAAEPNIANPVAFFTANDGRIYICETFRQDKAVTDNRSHMNLSLIHI